MNEAYINIMEQEKQLQLHITKNDRKIITDLQIPYRIRNISFGVCGRSRS